MTFSKRIWRSVAERLPNRSTAQKRHSNKLFFKFDTEVAPIQQIKLKMQDEEFLTDVLPLLRSEITYDAQKAYNVVYNALIDRLPGRRD